MATSHTAFYVYSRRELPRPGAFFSWRPASGGLSAFQPKSLGVLANTALATGNILTCEIAKAGAGVIVPRGKIVVYFTVD